MSVVNIYGDRLKYELALARINVTENGKMVSRFLGMPNRGFDIVILPPGSTYGQMMVEDDPVSEESTKARTEYVKHTRTKIIARPTVFWCPDYSFSYYGDVSGVAMQSDDTITIKQINSLVPGDYYYKYPNVGRFPPVSVPVVRYTKSEMPAWIVLHHELGHVKQYYSGTPEGWVRRLLDTADIEADNLATHENPICRSANIAIRANYKHMINGFGLVASAYAMENKKPALRVSDSTSSRVRDDIELEKKVMANAKTATVGFFKK